MIVIKEETLREYLEVRDLGDIYEDILLMSSNLRDDTDDIYGVFHPNNTGEYSEAGLVQDMYDTYEEALEVYEAYLNEGEQGFVGLVQSIDVVLHSNRD